MINIEIKANDIVKFIALVDNISSVSADMAEKSRAQFLFRGESKNHGKILLPKYLRPLNEGGVRVESHYLEGESNILSQFRNQAYPYIQNIDKNDNVAWREYAQHYGVPTRLLDWSSNPLVALFFACVADYEDDGIVWMINWQKYHASTNQEDVDGESLHDKSVMEMVKLAADNKPRLKNPVIYQPCYSNLRMSAQDSHFMLWGTNKDDLITQIGNEYVKEAEYIPSENKDGGSLKIYDPTILYYFNIDGNQKKKIALRLSRMGINHKTLFPGLEGVGTFVNDINRYTKQELIDYCMNDL